MFGFKCPNGCRDDSGDPIQMVDVEIGEGGRRKWVCPLCGYAERR